MPFYRHLLSFYATIQPIVWLWERDKGLCTATSARRWHCNQASNRYLFLLVQLQQSSSMANRQDSAAIRLLLEALESTGTLTRRRRRNYGLGVPQPPTYFDAGPDGFGFIPEPVDKSSFIGFFPLLRKIIWYFFVGILLLISSLCMYAGT